MTLATTAHDSTFSVVYRSGGTHNCQWTRVLDTFDRDGASAKRDEIELAGRKALVVKTGELNRNGLPIGWEPQFVNWDTDKIRIVSSDSGHQLQTFHVKAVA